ncbi:MAG: glycyl-radical enzyme activating protein [Promethearchaeota archaeon]
MMANRTNKGIIFDIKKYAIHDGPGIRTTIFLKGCALRCWWCHNPEGQKLELEVIYKKHDEKDSSFPPRKEIIGREVSVDEVMAEIEKDRIFYDESGGGVTFSGGEPLMQPDFLDQLLTACQELEIPTTLDTCGYASWEIVERIKDKVDLFLYDIKIIDDKDHQKYTGVSNILILSNFERLDKEGKNMIIRFPVITGITDTGQNIRQMTEWMSSLENVREINLLPYHKIGKGKYEKLNQLNRLKELDPPSSENLNQLSETFRAVGFKVKIGG